MNIGLVYRNNPVADDVGVLRKGEIHLKWLGRSDTGLTFDGRVELVSATDPDRIDENWARVTGPLGALVLGSDDDASDAHLVGYFETPSTIVGYFDSDVSPFQTSTGADTPMVMYTTPGFRDLVASVSWAPEVGIDGPADTALSFGDTAKLAVGATYRGALAGFDVVLGGGYLHVEERAKAWQAGAQIGRAGLALGVHVDEDGAPRGFSSLSVGLRYEAAPWTFAAGWSTALDGPDFNAWGAWVTWALAPGVTATIGYEGSDDRTVLGFDTTVAGWLRVGF